MRTLAVLPKMSRILTSFRSCRSWWELQLRKDQHGPRPPDRVRGRLFDGCIISPLSGAVATSTPRIRHPAPRTRKATPT